MKAVVSLTNDPVYSFFLPLIAWCWNKLDVDVICFVPASVTEATKFAMDEMNFNRNNRNLSYGFICPKHKEATYAQCSRLYAAALDLPKHEILITSDADMALFNIPKHMGGFMAIFGHDLVPPKQVPICYISGAVDEWRKRFKIMGRTYQECLDDLLGNIEADHFRGNYWAKDQEEAYNNLLGGHWPSNYAHLLPRAKPGTQFASHRVDRDDINWRSYCGPDLIDAHLWRPGYEESNFNNIMELLQTQYPNDDFDWVRNYRNEYIKLL
jgi:hypothetical protein